MRASALRGRLRDTGMSETDTWHLYLLRCANGDLYTGISTDVQRRLAQHASDRGARRLRGKGPLTLEFSAAVGNRSRAQRIEYRVKQWRRTQKEDLIAGRLSLPEPE